jgi:glutathione synthase/RimK-type ligase-like ATP-grasp enzyme
VRVVPTAHVDAGASVDVAELARSHGWREIVVKPAVSGGAHATTRVEEARGAQAHLEAILAKGDAMVQPYLPSVEARGEIAMVFFDGELSHAVRKHAQLDGTGVRDGGEPRVEPSRDDVRFAQSVLEAVPFAGPLLYARVDVVRDDDGAPCVMELEVVEPSLFLAQGNAAARFAEAIARRVR